MGQPVVHFEIGCRDAARTGEFYARLFDWKIRPSGPGSMIDTAACSGIQGHLTALGHEPHRYVAFYVEVDDLAAYIAKAESLGGHMLVPPVELAHGSFAWVADLDGNIVGLWKPKPHS